MNPCFPNLNHREPESIEPSSGTFSTIIRKLQLKDLSNLAELLADSFHDRSGLMHWTYPLFRLGIYEDLRMRLRSVTNNSICLVAVDSSLTPTNDLDYLLGTVEMALRATSVWQYQAPQYPYISNLAVRKSCRRRGVAQKLLLTCEKTAIEWGFKDIYLHVLENNRQARRLYFKSGYRLRYVEPKWTCCLFMRPRRLLLSKDLTNYCV